MGTITKTVEIDGEEHEVELDTDEMGLLTKDEHKSQVSEEVKRRVEAAKRKAREGRFTLDDVAEDEDLQKTLRDRYPELFEAASQNGDGGDDDALTEEDLARFREKWERENLKPVREELEQLSEEAKSLRVEKLNRQVQEAAAELGVRKGLRRALMLEYQNRMAYSEEDGEWFVQDGDGFELSTSDGDNRYVTVAEDIAERKSSGDLAPDWFESNQRAGAGFEGGGGGSASPPQKKKSEMTDREKRDFINEYGHEEFAKLPF